MFKNSNISISSIIFLNITPLFSINAINKDTLQSIQVINKSEHSMHIAANSNAHSLCIDYSVPANTHWSLVSQLMNVKSPQEMLFNAILNDSTIEIRQAIQAGANINQAIDGKSPIVLAFLTNRFEALKYLLQCGAI